MPTETEDRDRGLSRRLLLQRAAGPALAAAVITVRARPAVAVIKISKAAVAYQDHPDGDKHCAKCAQFQPPNSCKMVDGPISPQGFCRIFTPIRQASRPIRNELLTG